MYWMVVLFLFVECNLVFWLMVKLLGVLLDSSYFVMVVIGECVMCILVSGNWLIDFMSRLCMLLVIVCEVVLIIS